MSLSALLNEKLDLQRPTVSADGSGGTIRTYATVAAAVLCSVSPASSSVSADYARRDMIVNCSIYTTANLDVLIPGGVRLGDRLTDGSVFYLVKGVRKSANAVVTTEVLYQLDCELKSIT
jgi:hypothetical protein